MGRSSFQATVDLRFVLSNEILTNLITFKLHALLILLGCVTYSSCSGDVTLQDTNLLQDHKATILLKCT